MLKRLDLRNRPSPWDPGGELPRPSIAGDEPREAVREIIAAVRSGGDSALRRYTERFDRVVVDDVRVSDETLDEAVAAMDPAVIDAMRAAIDGIEDFHRHQVRSAVSYQRNGVHIQASQRPVQRAGLYVPGGRAEYPSTVMMTAVPARVAGVEDIVLCVPPDPVRGEVAPSVLAAARLAGVSSLYRVGGAQAIAAMAYGTESVPPVDVIAGPGNVYVALAKQEVAGDVGVAAAFAGPSEVVVVADDTADPRYAAIDVIVQAEHGPDGLAWLVTWDEQVADAVCAAGEELLDRSPRADEVRSTFAEGGYVALVDSPDQALVVVDAIAPEHVELQCREAEVLAQRINNAGAIFCGSMSPASLGDYVAGPSHVLPTFGSARFASALTVADFVKDHHVITASSEAMSVLGPHVVTLADLEGLDAHAESIRLRQQDIAAPPGAETTP